MIMDGPFERDIRIVIRDLLDATSAFDGVYLSGPPEHRGERGGDLRAAAIEPGETAASSCWDDVSGPLVMTARATIILMARDDDPQTRDEVAEQLLETTIAALDGRSLAGRTLPEWTGIRSWTWRKPTPPERRIEALLEFRYLVEDRVDADPTP